MHKPTEERFKCIDCTECTSTLNEYYMVTDEVWSLAGMAIEDTPYEYSGMLCIGCLENRLGRELNNRDFSSASINDPDFMWPGGHGHSEKLIKRLRTYE